jgi:iron complex outermembrane receptor protein/vitamin B12 transporter
MHASAHRRAGTAARFALHALAAACAAPLAAQAQAPGTPTVVVTGTRLPLSAAGLAQNVTIIDRAEIEANHVARIEDLLARVTGAYVDQAGSSGSFVSLYMRGAENSHLLILLDGVKLNDPTTTRGSAYDLSSIDVSQIDRIEVLRGPASAVYGGEALAGVVHIITKRAALQGLSGSAYAAAGGDHHRKAGAVVAFGADTVRAQIGAGHAGEGSSSEDSKLRLNSVNGSVRFAPATAFNAELFGSHIERESEAFPDDSGGPRLAVNRAKTLRDSTDNLFGGRLSYGEARLVRIDAVVSRFDRKERADNAAVDAGVRFPVPAFVSDTDFQRSNATVSATHDYGDRASVVLGAEYQKEEGELTSVGDFLFAGSPQTFSFQLDRKTKSVFAEGRMRVLPSLAVQLGVRRDKVDGLDGVTTPHLGVVWDLPNGATTLKANFNKGFKPPSFFALGFPIGANPDLRPERSKNAELTLAHRIDTDGSMAQVSVFQTDYEDLVDFDGTTFTNINRGKVVVKGVEPELKLYITPRWRVQANATLLQIEERDGRQPLRNRPERQAHAATWYELNDQHAVFAAVRHSGGFLDRSNPTGDINMPGFTVVDIGYTFTYGPMRVRLSLDNVLDKDYEQFVGFPAQGRRARAEVRATF